MNARHVLSLTGAALLVAGVLLVTVILPAEYAVDPLGTGRRLGVLALGEVGQQVAALDAAAAGGAASRAERVVAHDTALQHETITFTLAPRESMEYKYRLSQGEALHYSWRATGPVNVEFHAEPDGAPRGYAETYEKSAGQTMASGTLTTPFGGIHGWFWENTGDAPATVTLESAGFYTLSHEFRKDQPTKNREYRAQLTSGAGAGADPRVTAVAPAAAR